MTEVADTPKPSAGWPDSAADLNHTSDWYTAPDSRLQWMADTADTTTAGIGITLIASGGVISGTVISGQVFFEKTAESFRADAKADEPDGVREQLAESFFDFPAEQIAKHVKETSEAFEKGERDEPRWPLVRFIHLQDARFSVPGQEHHFPLGYTRVQLSQVVGWTCGARWVGTN